MNDTGIIIQARTTSTRLPGKVLLKLPFGGKTTLLERVIERCKASRLAGRVIIATTGEKADNPIVRIASKSRVPCYRGSRKDVLSRYYEAAKKFGIGTIVRVTSDCPFIDPEIIDVLIKVHRSGNFDYTSNTIKRTFPRGLDAEVFSFEALGRAHSKARRKPEREHVTPYIREHKEFRRCSAEIAGLGRFSGLRLTVDTIDDYALACEVYDRIFSGKRLFLLSDIIALFRANPWLAKINSHVEQKKS